MHLSIFLLTAVIDIYSISKGWVFDGIEIVCLCWRFGDRWEDHYLNFRPQKCNSKEAYKVGLWRNLQWGSHSPTQFWAFRRPWGLCVCVYIHVKCLFYCVLSLILYQIMIDKFWICYLYDLTESYMPLDTWSGWSRCRFSKQCIESVDTWLPRYHRNSMRSVRRRSFGSKTSLSVSIQTFPWGRCRLLHNRRYQKSMSSSN